MNRLLIGFCLAGVLAWLFVPAGSKESPPAADSRAFTWNQDQAWRMLEDNFDATRRAGCDESGERVDSLLDRLTADVEWLESGDRLASDVGFESMEAGVFAIAPLLAACPDRVQSILELVNRMRSALKMASRNWDIGDPLTRNRVYRSLYGARMAIEEVLLQNRTDAVPELLPVRDVPSQTPSVMVHGLRIHSGDILVSRGGAPVSALIARGNDYPGNFSHIALVHVSDQQQVSVIEAHIEVGVTVGTLEEYLAAKKMRIMVLRLDDSLEQLQADPLLPHRAATAALTEARERHVPYDFAMHYQDPAKKFCSEVASAAYAKFGVQLWDGLTTMSLGGTRAWLASLGVEQFETHGPSDLEYDPDVAVVAEWRDRAALFDDHLDNAVIDAMLEGAERGDRLGYQYRYLPLVRLAKAYSLLLNAFGKPGPVPEGMSATTALRSRWLDQQHARLKAAVLEQVAAFRDEHDYEPPYWQLVDMARAQLQ